MLLRGKTVLVTGVGAGLGAECVSAALREGANVALGARTEATLAAVVAELDPDGSRTVWAVTDITDETSCAALTAAAESKFGTIDAFVQVAAYDRANGGLFDTDFERWRAAYDTNVIGTLTMTREVAEVMKRGGGGSIVFIGSQSMFRPQLPQAGYAATKSALLTAMYYLVEELGPDNIRCNMVVPSWMWGPPVEMMVKYRSTKEDRTPNDVLEEIVGEFPLRRMTEDGEVADVAMFFASDLAKAVTGQHLLVNSGEYLS